MGGNQKKCLSQNKKCQKTLCHSESGVGGTDNPSKRKKKEQTISRSREVFRKPPVHRIPPRSIRTLSQRKLEWFWSLGDVFSSVWRRGHNAKSDNTWLFPYLLLLFMHTFFSSIWFNVFFSLKWNFNDFFFIKMGNHFFIKIRASENH